MTRKYQYIKELFTQIKEMLKIGMKQKNAENILGLIGDRTIHSVHHNPKTILCVMQTKEISKLQPSPA